MDQEEPVKEEIVLPRHRVHKQHICRLGSARIRRRLVCVIFSLILTGHLAACSMQPGPSKGEVVRPSGASVKARELAAAHPVQVDNTQKFEGEWSYRNDCDHGHYVTLELKRENDQLIGSWSDGTLLRGSQGLLKGKVANDRLIAEWCSEYEEAGAPALCPRYDWSEDYLVAQDGTIVWYQKYGQEYSEYVVLTKGNKPHRSTRTCDDDN